MPPLIFVSVAWIIGLLAAHYLLSPMGVKAEQLALLSLFPLSGLVLWRRDRGISIASFSVLFLVLATVRYQTQQSRVECPGSISCYNQAGWITLEGTVSGYPDAHDTWTHYRVDAEVLDLEGESHQVHGRVLVHAPRYPEYQYGDRLRISGFLETPPEAEVFSYREYLARKGIYSRMRYPRIEPVASDQGSVFWKIILSAKDRASAIVSRLMPEPEASLMQGILLGIRSSIPDELYEDYNQTGTSHIIVISGANITIVAALFAQTFGRLWGKRRAYWFAVIGIALYILLVGADPVVIRAGVMGALYITAIRLGRRSTAYVALIASAVVLTMINPQALWDLGFQLSFAAVLGLILFAPILERAFECMLVPAASNERIQSALRYFGDFVVITLAAGLMTLPLIAYSYQRVSLIAPIANLLIAPVQPPIMLLGGLATLVGLVPPLEPVARAVALLPWLCLAFTNTVVRWTAELPNASVQVARLSPGWLVAWYGMLLGIVWAFGEREGRRARTGILAGIPTSTKLIAGGTLIAALLACLALLQLPDQRLHVTFLDVGQGDAILITIPGGQQILVDGGPSPTALTAALGREMPFWDHSIDVVVSTHADADHITGLVEILDRYQVGAWLDAGCEDDDTLYLQCQERLTQASIPRQTVRAGDRLELGSGLALKVLHPSARLMSDTEADANNNSVVLRLEWGQMSFLLTGDLEAAGEERLIKSHQPLAATVLKVGHHGGGGSSTAPFLASVAPSYAVISVGIENRFGHPDPAALERLTQQGGIAILRTDEHGTIEFTTDGQRLWVQTDR